MCRSAELTLKPLGSSPYQNDKSLDSYTENTYSSQVTITNRVFYKPFLKLFYFKQIHPIFLSMTDLKESKQRLIQRVLINHCNN